MHISRIFEGVCQGVKTLYCLGLPVLGVKSVSCLGGRRSVFSPRCVVSVLSVDLYPQSGISGGLLPYCEVSKLLQGLYHKV